MKIFYLLALGLLLHFNFFAQQDYFITNIDGPNDILFDGDIMYYCDFNAVKSVDVTKNPLIIETIATFPLSTSNSPRRGIADLALRDQVLYAIEGSEDIIYKVDLTATDPKPEIRSKRPRWTMRQYLS